MVNVAVTKGQSLELFLTKLLRDNGLHVVQVHNGVVIRHGKLEKVQQETWVVEALEAAAQSEKPKKSKGTKSNET